MAQKSAKKKTAKKAQSNPAAAEKRAQFAKERQARAEQEKKAKAEQAKREKAQKKAAQKRTAPAKKPVQNKPAPQKATSAQKKPRSAQTRQAKQAQSAQNAQALAQRKAAAAAKPRSDQAVKRAMSGKSSSTRKRRNRGGNYTLYYLLAAVVVVLVFVLLANTVLFNCSSIEVEGGVRYSAEEIIEKSGIKDGANLLYIDTDEAEKSIISSLAYIDMAKVSKVYPTRIKISVTEAEKWYCVEQDGVKAAISRGGKVIELGGGAGLAVVRGFEAESLEAGKQLASIVPEKNTLPSAILDAAEQVGLKNITSIDISDRFSISVVVEDRVTLKLGNIQDVASKLTIAEVMIREELSPTEEVTILLSNPDQAAVHGNNTEIMPVLPEISQTAEAPESAETNETAES